MCRRNNNPSCSGGFGPSASVGTLLFASSTQAQKGFAVLKVSMSTVEMLCGWGCGRVPCVFHLTPAKVAAERQYAAWLRSLPGLQVGSCLCAALADVFACALVHLLQILGRGR